MSLEYSSMHIGDLLFRLKSRTISISGINGICKRISNVVMFLWTLYVVVSIVLVKDEVAHALYSTRKVFSFRRGFDDHR